MKNKFIGYSILILVYLFPFRYSFLEEHPTTVFWILSFLSVVIGTLAFFYYMFNSAEKAH